MDVSAGRRSNPLRVLVVDDHDAFRTGLAAILSEAGFVVDAATDGAAAVARARSFSPDVVLMDVEMPRVSGVDATRWLSRMMPSTRVVMLGYHEEGLLSAIRAGACGYLGKEITFEQLLAAIETVARGENVMSPRIGGALFAHLRKTPGGGAPDPRSRPPAQARARFARPASGIPGAQAAELAA